MKFLKNNYKNIILISLLFIIYTIICAFSYVNAVSAQISSNVFRLHVIANSNSDEDQNLKYFVRDSVLNYMKELTNNVDSKDEAIQIIQNNKDKFKEIALNTIKEQGYDYDVNIEIGNFEFPTKTYGDISLPCGSYDALKIEIGDAKGKNWWCVMFPPLCFVDITSGIVPEDSKNVLESNLDDEEYNLISTNSAEMEVKFKIVELFNNVKNDFNMLLAKN